MQSRQSSRSTVAVLPSSGTRQWLRFTLVSLLMLALATVTSISLSPAVTAQSTGTGVAESEPEPTDVAERVSDTAVTVYSYAPGGIFSPGQTGREPTGAGSGWVYSDDGLVVTNAHVVNGAERILVVLNDGTQIPVSLVGTDWYQDVAVLRMEPDGDQELPPAATVGDSSLVRAGDQVIAIGTPLGQFANTVSVGHVGATGRSLNTGTGYSLLNLIQHDASLSPGNSGGPLFSMDGEVIGMNVARLDSLSSGQPLTENVSFAIDGNTVVASAEEIIANGSATYPWLGVTSEITPQGQAVTNVEEGSPAAAGGLAPGDLITAIEGDTIAVSQPFIDLLYRHEPGDTVALTVVRDDGEIEIEVELGTRPGDV